MTRRYQTSGRFELKLPMAVVESCWLMKVNSELRLTAFSSDSVRLNIFLQKSKDHVNLFFSATENLPYFEVASDHYKCSVETVLEDDVTPDSVKCSYVREQQISAKSVPFSPTENSYDSRKNRGELGENIVDSDILEQELDTGQIKEECDEGTGTADRSSIDTLPILHHLHALKAEQAASNDKASGYLENNNYDSDSDTISFTNEDVKDEQHETSDGFMSMGVNSIDELFARSEPRRRSPKYSKQGACPFCGVYYGNLAQHVFSYCSKNPERIRSFHCCYCKHKVHSKEELIEHKRSHVLTRDFKCEICDAGFFTRQRLIRHMRYVHLVGNNPVKIYTCSVCEKRFHYRSHYDRHVTIHQEEKSVQCELCGKLFKNKHNVRNHQQRMHPAKLAITDFPYYCEKCGEGILHLGSHRCVEAQRPRLKFSRHSSANNFQGIFSDLPSEDIDSTEDGFVQTSSNSPLSFLP